MRRFFQSVTARAFLAAALLAGGWGSAWANPSLLFDVKTGEVLEHQDAFQRWRPASLTKLMTAYVAFRALASGEATLDSPIRITRHAASMPPAKMGFPAGSVLSLDNALKIIMVKSANDVAMAIGENIGGSQGAFAARMNAEAARLGMNGSHWANPNGLSDPDQYTTAHDLALLVRAIRTEFPQYAPYFSIDGIVFGKKLIKTYNTLMGRYPGADGMKTGFVCASGFNLIGTATRDGRTLGAVVLGAESPDARAEEASKLLSAGFEPPPAPKPEAAAPTSPAAPAPAQAPAPETLATLQPYGGAERDTAPDLHDLVCRKKPKAQQSEAPQPAETVTPEPAVVADAAYQPRLEVVVLGNAAGPVPKAMLDASGKVKEDVPLPVWRPDRPVPAGVEPLVQGGDIGRHGPVQAGAPERAPLEERFGGSSLPEQGKSRS